jgi:hypothetical protein
MQSYIRQYGKMVSGPEKAFSVLAFHETNLLLQCSDSFDESTGGVPQGNHQFVFGTSVLLQMA